MAKSHANKYGALSIGLHWLILLLLALVYATIELRGIFPKGSEYRELIKTWHYMLGLSVFALVWVRLAARLWYATPAIQPPPPKWQMLSAQVMHIALYVFMIAMPLLGWTLLSAGGKVIPFYGLHLPALVSESKSLAHQVKEIHETIGTVGYFLIGLHAAAALFHHYIMGDNTLQRMSPFKSQ